MIPSNIDAKHILDALHEIDIRGIPNNRKSRKYLLFYEGKCYPPKYVVSIANRYANGYELDSSHFSGGKETNSSLEALGFEITDSIPQCVSRVKSEPKPRKSSVKYQHNERCKDCKSTVLSMLEKLYGKVYQNHKIEVQTHPQAIESLNNDALTRIFEALQKHRGFQKFIKADILPACDFYIPNPGLVVEFDESQHFTEPRKISLSLYPEDLLLGFNRDRWIKLCDRINAKDQRPVFRDEQRAWYDTLRDFLPLLKGLRPTNRLFSKDFIWCSLNPDRHEDVQRFKRLLSYKSSSWEVVVRKSPKPFAARIIIADDWQGDPTMASELLERVIDNWPEGKQVRFLVTCGGFIQFDWPEGITKRKIGDNLNPNPEVVKVLVRRAEECANNVLNNSILERLKRLTDYVALGIDSYKEKVSTTRNYIGRPHAELILISDLKNRRILWTGKSYPTISQQNGIVRITDLKTHFMDLENIGKTMVLGCHDLTVFNPRSKNATGWRRDENRRIRNLAKQQRPEVVLHHPHTTDSTMTWASAWSGLRKTLPWVRNYCGAGRYYNADDPGGERSDLDDILAKTKSGETIDFIIKLS